MGFKTREKWPRTDWDVSPRLVGRLVGDWPVKHDADNYIACAKHITAATPFANMSIPLVGYVYRPKILCRLLARRETSTMVLRVI